MRPSVLLKVAASISLSLATAAQDPVAEEDAKPAQAPRQEPAAQDLGETLVTARKWEEPIQDVPQSMSSLSGAELQDAGIRTLRDATLLVPNYNLTEFSARRASFPFVRGIGSGQGEPAVSTYVDGVPQLTTGSANLPLIGLERVEFLRGPQSTLYGRNALGGVMHLISERPTDTPRFGAFAGFGNYDLAELGFSYSGPLGGDDLRGDFQAFQSWRDGYTTNDFTGNRVDSRDAFFGRAQLHLRPSESSELRFGVHGEHARDGAYALGFLTSFPGQPGLRERPYHINQDFEGVTERDVVAPSVAFEQFGKSVDFVSITAFTDWDLLETSDFDFSPIDGVRRQTEESQSYLYQELRLSSAREAPLELSDSMDLRWLLGVSGFVADSDRDEANEFRPGGAGIFFPPEAVGTDARSGSFDDAAGAVFGQATVIVDQRLELGLGLRYDYESKDADLRRTFESGGFTFLDESRSEEESFDAVLPRFSAGYHLDEETLVYGLAAKGFKAGGFNLAAPEGSISFGEETSWTYEAGFKRSFLENRIRLAAAIFFIDWSDMQLSLFDAIVGGYVTNAGESTSRGFEVELAGEVADGLDLFGGLGFTDTEFDEFVDPYGQDAAGNSLPFAPEETWSVGAQYHRAMAQDARWFLRAEYVGVGTFYYDAANREDESYQLVNLRGGIGKSGWTVELWARNLLEEEYVPVAFQPNPADPTLFVGENGAPRTYGFTLRAAF